MGYRIPEEYIGKNFSDEVKNLVRLTLAFTKAVGKHQDDPADNLVVSPYNALMALSMATKAATGETQKQMAEVLFGDSDVGVDLESERFMTLNKDILDANKDSVTLTTANAFWLNDDQGLALNEKYAADLKEVFDAEISTESFADPATTEKMNQWASDNTNKLIPEIVEEGSLTSDDLALLACSLYFKGDWTNEFDKGLTEDKVFTSDDGQRSLTAMMSQEFEEEGEVQYQDGDDFEAVDLTYGQMDPDKGTYPTMRIVLIRPKDDNVSARDWLNSQDENKIPAWVEPQAFESAVGTVELPHLDMKETYDLIDPLKDLGIEDAFNGVDADFSPLTADGRDDVYINKVQHDVVFKTDEKGSEAAAVTQVGFALECCMPDPVSINVEFNRSFVLMMQDVKTGAPLFVGSVNKPNDKMKPQGRTCGNENPPRP